MSTIPIFNPQSPYLGLIPGGLRIGSTLKIQAVIQGYANRCQIYLQSGAALRPRDDVMFHLSIRPQERAIVRNHMQNQVWGSEERHGNYTIEPHQSFEISITANPSNYRVNVNNTYFCTFPYRMPVNLVRYVSIDGTCTISSIQVDSFGGSSVYPPVPSHPVHHQPPAPPPMPPMPPHAPPPYPGFYPGHHHPTPYTVFKHELMEKMNNLKHH